MLGSKIKLKTGAGIGSGVSAGSLKTASAISATLQTVTDTAGNNSALAISSAAVNIGSGTITNNGTLTVKGAGANIVSFRNAANAEVASIANPGHLQTTADITTSSATAQFKINDTKLGRGGADGVFQMMNNAENDFTRLIFGANSATGVSIRKSGTGIVFSLGNASANASVLAKDYTSDNLSAGTLTTARPMRFGDRATITEAGFIALGLNRQIAIEHNGVIYYIPVSTTLIP
jgi:hypothetical protein